MMLSPWDVKGDQLRPLAFQYIIRAAADNGTKTVSSFVAGDTWRVDRHSMGRRVSKVHHWSDTVLLAQACEAQFLTQLIGAVRPLMGFYPETDEGFVEAFAQLNGKFWRKAEEEYTEKGSSPVPEDTVLARIMQRMLADVV